MTESKFGVHESNTCWEGYLALWDFRKLYLLIFKFDRMSSLVEDTILLSTF